MNPLSNDELISAYLDGELSGEEQQRAEKLLAEDADSRQLLEELRSLRAGMESLPRHQLDQDFASRVLDQAERTMIAGDATKGDSEAAKALTTDTFIAPPVEHGMTRERWIRLLAWPSIAIAAAIMITTFLPQDNELAVMNEPSVDHAAPKRTGAAPSDGVMSQAPAEVPVMTAPPAVAGGRAKSGEFAKAGKSAGEKRQEPLESLEPDVPEDNPFAAGNEDEADKYKVFAVEEEAPFDPVSTEASPAESDLAAGAGPPNNAPPAKSKLQPRSNTPLAALALAPAHRDTWIDREIRENKRLGRVDAVALMVPKQTEETSRASLPDVWSRHQLVATAVPRPQGSRGQADRNSDDLRSESEKDRRSQTATHSLDFSNASPTDQVFVIEGTEAQVRAAFKELSDQTGGYQFRIASYHPRPNRAEKKSAYPTSIPEAAPGPPTASRPRPKPQPEEVEAEETDSEDEFADSDAARQDAPRQDDSEADPESEPKPTDESTFGDDNPFADKAPQSDPPPAADERKADKPAVEENEQAAGDRTVDEDGGVDVDVDEEEAEPEEAADLKDQETVRVMIVLRSPQTAPIQPTAPTTAPTTQPADSADNDPAK